ncbi:MAG: hypothetical protein AAF191_09870, partial [Verrucomicrobiota bacterium]
VFTHTGIDDCADIVVTEITDEVLDLHFSEASYLYRWYQACVWETAPTPSNQPHNADRNQVRRLDRAEKETGERALIRGGWGEKRG